LLKEGLIDLHGDSPSESPAESPMEGWGDSHVDQRLHVLQDTVRQEIWPWYLWHIAWRLSGL